MRLIVVLVAASVLAVPVALAEGSFPATIPLPNGWQPEGIAVGNGKTFYAGSRATGAVYSGDLRTGKGAVLVQGAAGRRGDRAQARPRTALRLGRGDRQGLRLRREDGRPDPRVPAGDAAGTFINDVAVTNDAAYFTDSNRAVIFKLPRGSDGTLPAAARRSR